MRRIALWLVESNLGRLIFGALGVAFWLAPMYWLGYWWLFASTGVMLAFIAGWAAARRHWRKHGFVPKL